MFANPSISAGSDWIAGPDAMTRRNVRKTRLTAVMRCSDGQLYNYMARLIPVPGMQLGALCDIMDMDVEELVDDGYVLLETEPRTPAPVAPDEFDEFDDGW